MTSPDPAGVLRGDPDEHAELRDELARSERMRGVLAEVIVTVGANLGLQALVERVCSIIDDAYEPYGVTHAAVLYLWDPEIERLVVRASTGAPSRPRGMRPPLFVTAAEVQLRLGEGLTGWVAEHREVLALPDGWA